MSSSERDTAAPPPCAGALNGDRDLLAVERALGELRRGRAVVITGGDAPVLAMSVETLTRDGFRRLRAAAGARMSLAISGERARALGLGGGAGEALAMPLPDGLDLDAVRTLAGIGAEELPEHPAALPAGGSSAPLAAAVTLARHARLVPAVVAVTAEPAALDDSLLQVSAAQAAGYREGGGRSLERIARARVPLRDEENCELVLYRDTGHDREHLAIVVGDVRGNGATVPVRVHSACLTGDVLASLRCDCGDQLRGAVRRMSERGGGVLLYLDQEGRGIGLANKLRAYALQDAGLDTFDADERLGFGPDERSFTEAAAMLRDLGVTRIRLLTNNPHKVEVLAREGIAVESREPITGERTGHNERYLDAKARRAGHDLVDD